MSEALSPQRAESYILDLGVADLATELCRVNTAVGLAKIHWAQRALGREPDALFLGGPDMTVTRNLPRWESGFAYGGVVDWGGGEEPLVVLEVKPNVCGMLVAGLAELPTAATLAERLAGLRRDPGEVDGLPLEFDLDRSNHFVNLYRLLPGAPAGQGGSQHVVILHGAAPEIRDDHRYGWGLYWDRSPALRRAARRFNTPWGPLHVLVGASAETYFTAQRQAAEFAAQRRLVQAHRLFGELTVLANDLHQGLTSPSRMYLGCHPVSDPGAPLPFTVRPGEVAYLLRGAGRVDLARVTWAERARSLGLAERVEEIRLLPHGAGYAVAGPGEVTREPGADRPHVWLSRAGVRTDSPREMVTGYRGEEVLTRALELGLGEIAARLEFVAQMVAP